MFPGCESAGGACTDETGSLEYDCLSEYHHSLAMACLVDDSMLEDGWSAGNRGSWSSGAGTL